MVVTFRDRGGATLRPERALLAGEAGARELSADARESWSVASTELAAGQLQLRVELPERPELRLMLSARRGKHGLALAFAGNKPLCAELRQQGPRTQLEITLGVTHKEVIFVSGWDYSGGSEHRRWCETWRDDLREGQTWLCGEPREIARLIDEHTIVTLFDFETGERIQQLAADGGWHECDRGVQGSVPTHLGPLLDEDANEKRRTDDSISIVHVYRHIIELGRRSPGSLLALHVFSHAWAGGPILVNTDESRRYAGSPQRDPADKDGRTKDFSPTNMPEREHFAAAFGRGAIAKIWGCYATTLYRRMARAAAKALEPDTPLTVRADEHVRKLSAAQIVEEFRAVILGDSYMARLGRAAGITVYGAPPGMGANLERVGKRWYMYVDQGVYALEYRWYAQALGLEPDVSGHFAYTHGAAVE